MKQTSSIAILMIASLIFILSCRKAYNISQQERLLNLKAPSGQMVAKDILTLKTRVGKAIITKYGYASDFEIVGIDYLAAQQGVAAIIGFKLADGTYGNYVSLSGVRHKLLPSGFKVFLNDKSPAREPAEEYVCVKKEDCTAQCNASPIVTVYPQTGEVDIDCGCNRKCEAKKVSQS